MKKITQIVFFFIVSFAVLTSMVSAVFFKKMEGMLFFLDEQLWSRHPQIMEMPIDGDYPLSIYCKDMIVNAGLYKQVAMFLSFFLFIAFVSLLFFYKKFCSLKTK